MCAISYQEEPSIADKDIVCFKVMQNDNTPFIETKVDFDKELVASEKGYAEHTVSGAFVIRDGYIHAFKSEDTARSLKRFLNESTRKDHQVWECVIQKGTEYFECFDFSKNLCYASDKLKFVKQIF